MRRLVVAFGVAAFAVVGLAACGDDGDSAQDLQEEVAENRLGGCLQDAGISIDVFTDLDIEGLDDIIDGLFEEFGDATDIEDVDSFFTEFDEEISDFSEDLTDEDLSDDFGTASGEFSEDLDEALSNEDALFDFLDCLGISEQEFSDFFEEQFSDDFTDDFTEDFTEDDFSDDFTDDDFTEDEFTEETDDF